MATSTRKIEFKKQDENGKPLPAYAVLVDGETVGMVWKLRVRHTHSAPGSRIASGYSYSTEWRWSTRIHDEFPTWDRNRWAKRTKAAAVDALLAEVSK